MILLTGVAGFIGMHVARRLLGQGRPVYGIDSMGACADPALRQQRLSLLQGEPGFRFGQVDLAEPAAVDKLFADTHFDRVIHLAAQTGVRYSAERPHACVMNNVVGFANLIEACRRQGSAHLLYASSSSIYGANALLPFSEHHPASHPLSLYAATKRSNELQAHCYSHQYALPTTGLRFFTVYGPWGRPDMAPMLFAHAIVRGEPVDVFNNGNMLRDFTFIDDVAEAVAQLVDRVPAPDPQFDPANPDPATSSAPYRIYNVGSQQPTELSDFIDALEQAFGRKAERRMLPMHAADMRATSADTRTLEHLLHWAPATSLATGIGQFARWYEAYHA